MSNTVHSIEIRNLWKKYDFFWENLNPDVNILIGINGSGKTTLFNIIDSIMMADVKRLRIYGVGVKITIDDYTVDFQQKMTAGELKTALRNVKYQKISTFDVPFRDRPKAGKEYSQLYNELHTIVYDIGGRLISLKKPAGLINASKHFLRRSTGFLPKHRRPFKSIRIPII